MRPRNWLFDALLALVLAHAAVIGTPYAGLRQPGSARVDGVAVALIVLAGAALVVRRRWPLVTFAVTAGATSVYLLRGLPYGPILFICGVAVYTVAMLLPTRRAVPTGVVALVLVVLHNVTGPADLAALLPETAVVVVPFALGTTVRLSRDAARRAREERAREVASDERLRVAQEVHDVVGHGLAAINMQAEIALHLLPSRPEQAEVALTAISRTSKEALDELRATLSVLRRSGEERAPTPGLAQLPALVDRLTGTGLAVTLDVPGEPPDLPLAVDLAAYRVVQEALTNVLRHAGSATATVRVAYLPDALTVEVTDTGTGGRAAPVGGGGGRAAPAGGPAPAGGSGGPSSARTDEGRGSGPVAGHGIPGMRERVTALGGTFTAGPLPGTGFRVYARLPVEDRR
ncbi:sensor histidine kinase [Micromonospora zhanjiangensis]|uniref:histidine kinase n=1 Tax=Micromonospora zhanjiangensis TaxID=1522057 RepID=A0ABV8KG85_9ACTN